MAELLHLIATDEGSDFGWSLASPQLPELVYGRPDFDQFLRGIPDVVRFAGALDGCPQEIHEQRRFATADGDEYIVRVARDSHVDERIATAERVQAVLGELVNRDQILTGDRLATGDLLIICALPTDRLGWAFGQISPGSVAQLMTTGTRSAVWCNQIARGGDQKSGGFDLEEIGLTLDSTVADLLQAVGIRSSSADVTAANPVHIAA